MKLRNIFSDEEHIKLGTSAPSNKNITENSLFVALLDSCCNLSKNSFLNS
ncbi:hypothetical protein PGB90_001209 [Kerria lacca]